MTQRVQRRIHGGARYDEFDAMVMPTEGAVSHPVATAISEIWHSVLEVPISDDGDFFSLGGTSRDAMTLMMLVEDRLNLEFPVDVFMTDSRLSVLIEKCVAQECTMTWEADRPAPRNDP